MLTLYLCFLAGEETTLNLPSAYSYCTVFVAATLPQFCCCLLFCLRLLLIAKLRIGRFAHASSGRSHLLLVRLFLTLLPSLSSLLSQTQHIFLC